MQGGKLAHWELLELAVNVDGGVSISGTPAKAYGYSGSLTSLYTPTPFVTDIGIQLSCGSEHNPFMLPSGDVTSWTINIPGIITKTVTENVFQDVVSTSAEFDNFRVYALNGAVWMVKWDELRWYRDGTLDTTIGERELLGIIFTPSGIPILGIAPTLAAGAFANPVPVIGGVPDGNITEPYQIVVNAVATGGWRFTAEGEGATALPVQIQRASIPDIPPPCECEPTLGTADAENTWEGTANGYYREHFSKGEVTTYTCWDCGGGKVAVIPFIVDVWQASMEVETRGGSVTLLPSLTKSVLRMNDDYKAMIVRGGFPYAKAAGSASCATEPLDPGGSTSTSTNITTIHPSYTTFLATVDNDTHLIEEPYSKLSYAPYSEGGSIWTATQTQTHTSNPGACPPDEIDPGGDPPPPPDTPIPCYPVIQEFCMTSLAGAYPSVEDENTNPYLLPHLYHPDYLARYINYNANQHWSYLYFFPADEDEEQWKVYDEKQNSDAYWVPIRTQYLEHTALPSGERPKTRNSLVSPPLYEGCYSAWIKGSVIANAESSFWGIHRFDAQNYTPSAFKQLNAESAASWTFEDCTPSFESDGITLTPIDDATEFKATYSIGNFNEVPYLYPHLADRIYIDWYEPNIVSVVAYLQNIKGKATFLADEIGLHAKPLDAFDSHYAGSWAQDFGNGIVPDSGTDSKPQGISEETLIDAERVHYFQLLGGRGAASLRFDITVEDGEETAKIKYPKFYISEDDVTVIQESGHHASLIYPNGVGTRYGQWAWLRTDPFTRLLDVPDVYPIGYPPLGWKSSVLDWLCYRREVLQGINRSFVLAAEIQTLYDNIELIGVDTEPSGNNQIYRECDSFTTSFIVEHGKAGTGILVNSAAEVPPVANFPWRSRGEDWEATEDYAQISYSFAQEPRYYVHPIKAMHIFDGETQWTEDVPEPPEGWKITKHTHELTNNEAGFNVRLEGDDNNYASVTPWHGYFANIFVILEQSAQGVSYDTSDAMRHYLAYIDDNGRVWMKRADNIIPFGWNEVDTSIDATAICVRVDRRSKKQSLYLAFAQDDEIKLATSLDEGATWTMPETIAPGTFPALLISRSGTRYIYWVDGTDIKGQIRSPQNEILEATFTAISGIDEDTGIAADESYSSKGESRITLAYIDGGSATTQTSSDGKTFS
jgi:hypothetical protein